MDFLNALSDNELAVAAICFVFVLVALRIAGGNGR